MLQWLHVLTSVENTGLLGVSELLQLHGQATSPSVACVFVDLVGNAY